MKSPSRAAPYQPPSYERMSAARRLLDAHSIPTDSPKLLLAGLARRYCDCDLCRRAMAICVEARALAELGQALWCSFGPRERAEILTRGIADSRVLFHLPPLHRKDDEPHGPDP